MLKKFIISIILFGLGLSAEPCPDYITCETSETADSCPEGKCYRENVKVNGCCPGCVDCATLKGENEPCNVPADCQPGLTCPGSTKQCVKDEKQACEYYKRYDKIFTKTKYWKPRCLPDGTYAPKQCKGEAISGRCFCVSKMGKRIFGEEDWKHAENMTCACSRLLDDLRQKGEIVHLHCNGQGNFEPLQCDEKTCWCANSATGIPYTVMVPPEMATSLPCYNPDSVGAQYYRQCDSGNHMQEVAASLLRRHGTTTMAFGSLECNSDGSFHRVQTLRDKKRCVYIDNSPLTEYFEGDPNCNCVYDKNTAALTQTEFLPFCLPNGNYQNWQIWGNNYFCLDEDGFYYSSDVRDCPKKRTAFSLSSR